MRIVLASLVLTIAASCAPAFAAVKITHFDRNGLLQWTNDFCTTAPVYEIVRSTTIEGPWQHVAFVTNGHSFNLSAPSPGQMSLFYQVAWVDDDPVVLDYAYDEHGIGEPSVIGTLALHLTSRSVGWFFEETDFNTSPHPLGARTLLNAIRMSPDGRTIVVLRFDSLDDAVYLEGRLEASPSSTGCNYTYSGVVVWVNFTGETPIGTFIAEQ